MRDLVVISIAVVAWGSVSGRLPAWLTPPLAMLTVGLAVGQPGLGLVDPARTDVFAELVLSATLALVLFHDASRIDVSVLRRSAGIPARLLVVGLPLTIAAGAALAFVLLGLDAPLAAAVGATLAPTDAALGQAVVSNPRVPARIRQALNVESGLNDGIALPFVQVAVALAAAEMGVSAPGPAEALVELAGGAAIGAVVGLVGGVVLRRAFDASWTQPAFRQSAVLVLPAIAFGAAELAGANGFVATFVAGGVWGRTVSQRLAEPLSELLEDTGQLLTLGTFLVFGAVAAGAPLGSVTPATALYVLASLTVVRMVPVAIALVGTHMRPPTVAYLGWFGPRGLASIIYGLLILEELGDTRGETAFDVVVLTVVASVVAHGVTAAPWSDRYAEWSRRLEAHRTEMMPADAQRVRFRDPGGR